MVSIGHSFSPVAAAIFLARVDLPPPALPNTATRFMRHTIHGLDCKATRRREVH